MLTPEQCYAVDYFMKELPLKVKAFAGAGKTSTLTTMARQQKHRRGMYIAFNKAIATDAAGKFPGSVSCKTAHSLAFREIAGRGFETGQKMGTRPRSRTFDVSTVTDKFPFHVDTFKSIVATTLVRFCQSDGRSITEHYVPYMPGLTEDDREFVYKWAPQVAADVWSRMVDPGDDMPLGHDGYLKLWALGNPRLFADYLMVDEAQDLNGVLIGIVRNQQAQIVTVGDSHQSIYEWRGAKDALVILPGHEARLTKSFRFGDTIATEANRVLEAMGESFPLHGHSAIRDAVSGNRSTTVEAVLCRSNAGVIDQAIEFMVADRTVATPGGTGEMRAMLDDAEALQSDMLPRLPEFLGFETWKQVQDYSQTDEGAGVKVFVNLVGKYGVTRLRNVLDKIKDKAFPGDVTISTAHKAKGLEWSSVLINDDFHPGDGKISTAERRLFYVAITRAKTALFVAPEMMDAFSLTEE